jgi:hypothetical protein
VIWEYYKKAHLLARFQKPPKFIYHIEYPLEDTTLELQDAYYEGTLDKHGATKAYNVRKEIKKLEEKGWSGCSQSALDKAEADRKEFLAAQEDKQDTESNQRLDRIVQNM